MGYYENPPIVAPNKSSDIMASYILDASNSVASALNKIGERKRAAEKEERLTIQKLQDRKNQSDLYYNQKYNDWKEKESPITGDVDSKIQILIQQKIQTAADNRVKLLNEVDPKLRATYLQDISNADGLLTNSGKFAKLLSGQVATWRLKTPAIKVGEIGGNMVNGANDQERLENTGLLEILGGNDANYTDPNIDVKENSTGDGIALTVSGIDKTSGKKFTKTIDSNFFNKSDEEADNGLLIPVESNDTFVKTAKQSFFDEKGQEILPGFLSPTHYTYDLDSKGSSNGKEKDVYQISDGRMLQYDAIKAQVDQKSDVGATGILAAYANKPAKLRNYIACTLKKGLQYYDETFIKLDAATQKQELQKMMTDDVMNSVTKPLETTTKPDGTKIYWAPSPNIKLKDQYKEDKTKQEKEPYVPITSGDYDKIITDYNPSNKNESLKNLANTINNLSTSPGKYVSREELYQKYLNEPYVYGTHDTGLTVEEAYKEGKIKKNPSESFRKEYGTSQMYSQAGPGDYRPIQGYDFSKAADRVKFALLNTAGEADKKALKDKLVLARRQDWMNSNPKKSGETDLQYAQRIRNAVK